MAAPDIVGVDLQLWLGVDPRTLTEQQIGVALVGFDSLGVFVDHDLAVEHCGGGVGCKAFVEFVRMPVGFGVVNPSVVVHKGVAAG